MRDRPPPSALLVMIAVTAVIAAVAVGSASAIGDASGPGGKDCLPTITGRHYAVSLDLRCARAMDKAAARPPRKAGS